MDPFSLWHQIATSSGLAFALPEECAISATGSDARRFLNGQLTADLRRLQPGTRLRACLLTPKGRTLSEVWCHVEGTPGSETFTLRAPAVLGEEIFARLDRYLVADDVSLDLQLAAPLWHCLSPFPLDPNAFPHLTAVRRRIPGVDLAAEQAAFLPQAFPGLRLLTAEESLHFQLAGGEPSYPNELAPQPFPAEVGLDQTAVDFHKGCYLGQEVVSRLESVGRVRQELRRVISLNPDHIISPKIGDAIFHAAEPVGHLTSWTLTPSLPQIGLAMLKVAEVDAITELHLQSSPGLPSALGVLPLSPELPSG